MDERELALLFLAYHCWSRGSRLFSHSDVAYAIQKRLDSRGSTAIDDLWRELNQSDRRVRQEFDDMVDRWKAEREKKEAT